MPSYTIESNYRLPVFRHRTYDAETPEDACRAAIEDDDWDRGKEDYESGVRPMSPASGGELIPPILALLSPFPLSSRKCCSGRPGIWKPCSVC